MVFVSSIQMIGDIKSSEFNISIFECFRISKGQYSNSQCKKFLYFFRICCGCWSFATLSKTDQQSGKIELKIERHCKYSGDLNSRLVWILKGQKEVGFQMVQISNGIWNTEAQPFEIWTKGHHSVKNHLNLDKNVWISNGPVFKWLGL